MNKVAQEAMGRIQNWAIKRVPGMNQLASPISITSSRTLEGTFSVCPVGSRMYLSPPKKEPMAQQNRESSRSQNRRVNQMEVDETTDLSIAFIVKR